MAFGLVGTIISAQNKTSSTTLTGTCLIAASVGDLIVLTLSADNDSTTNPTFSVSDSGGNTWNIVDQATIGATPRVGIAGAQVWCQVTTALTTSSTITMTLSTAAVARAMTARLFTTGGTVSAGSPVRISGSLASITITSDTAAVDELVFASAAVEEASISAYDSDTTNGTWSSGVEAKTTGGGVQSNVIALDQFKIQTTTSSTQTWNVTLPAATDRIAFITVFSESAPTTNADAGVIATTVTMLDPTATGSGSATTDVIATDVVMPAATGSTSAGADANAPVIATVVTMLDPTATASGEASAPVIATAVVMLDPTATASGDAAAPVIATVVAMQAPTTSTAIEAVAPLISTIVTMLAPTVALSSSAPAPVIATVVVMHTPDGVVVVAAVAGFLLSRIIPQPIASSDRATLILGRIIPLAPSTR